MKQSKKMKISSARNNNFEMVNLLLEAGAVVKDIDGKKLTELDITKEIKKYLQEN